MPGIVEPHSHIYGGALRHLERLGFKYPPSGIVVNMQADRDLEKTQAMMRDKIQEAVKKVNPGEWVVLGISGNPEAPSEASFWGFTRRLTNRKTLDVWAPENPLLVRPGPRGWINGKAMDVLNEFLPGYSASIQETMHGDVINEDIAAIGWVGSQEMSVIDWELFLAQLPPNVLAQALKIVSEEFAALGVTTFSSRIQFPKIMTGYATLAGMGQMPIRFAGHYEVHRMPTDPQATRQIYRRTGVLQGIGDDYFWFDGVASERWDSIYPESCTGPDTVAPPHIKAREVCPVPGELPWDVLENAVKSGWRLAGVHIAGSEAARAYFKMVDRAREVNGWSMEDVRSMRLTGEHCNVVGQVPDVIQGLKDYGIILSCGPNYLHDVRDWIKDYGPQIEPFILPFQTWIDSGVKLVGQHFAASATRQGTQRFQPPFYMPWLSVTRKYDGEVWQPKERLHRVHALKMFTNWAAEYVLKEDKIGSLEEGKYADLLVIDRDYFTVPVDEILRIRPLMTMVGGKMIVLQESLANDFGVEAVGPSYDFSEEDVEHLGKPVSEIAKKFMGN
jgi:predicted amidohydrolase YtcJ